MIFCKACRSKIWKKKIWKKASLENGFDTMVQ